MSLMNLEYILLSERSQTKNATLWYHFIYMKYYKDKIIETIHTSVINKDFQGQGGV